MTDLLVEESKSTVFEMNTSMKMRDVEFEVRRLLNSPETIPPQFHMPSQQLCKTATGVTQAVQDQVSPQLCCPCSIFSRSIRVDVALCIQGKVRQDYTPDVLVKRLNFFATEVLNNITDAEGEICVLFQPQPDKHLSHLHHLLRRLQLKLQLL
eukprot:superscaffoldBa00000015_g305